MELSRRDFLRSFLITCGGAVPVFLARSAAALAADVSSSCFNWTAATTD
jgi:hypothetical protein